MVNVLLQILHVDCTGDTVIDWRGSAMTFLLLTPLIFFGGVASDMMMIIIILLCTHLFGIAAISSQQ